MQSDIGNFLSLGYYLDYPNNLNFDGVTINESKYEKANADDLLSIADEIISSIFDDLYISGILKELVIPLSGGLDSRLLLSVLLRYYEAKDVNTFTFGSKGSYDYDIANKIAFDIGTSHISLDLSKCEFSIESLLFDNNVINGQSALFYSTPFFEIEKIYGKGLSFLSGFMGDPVAGSKLQKVEIPRDKVCSAFYKKNRITNLVGDEEINLSYVECKIIEGLSMYESIDFFNRQAKYVLPHVTPNNNYISPFLDKRWLEFWLSLPKEYRLDTKLYNRYCVKKHERLFSFPVRNLHNNKIGSNAFSVLYNRSDNLFRLRMSEILGRYYLDKRTNYFDFNSKLNQSREFKKNVMYLIDTGLLYAEKNGVLIKGISKEKMNTYDLIVLASLGVQAIEKQN
ncbi:asparagine synthase-related protein [Vibrio alginolyticus]|uniref:asparagine synthase-related protein n=1 Tax=Vibrio alginolyticus TaxID=663 RepID=UPI003751CE56